METSDLIAIEKRIERLSNEEKLWLIERVAHGMRQNGAPGSNVTSNVLFEMSRDPEIRRELRAIEAEFGPSEMDGLE